MTFLPDADIVNYILKEIPPVPDRFREAASASSIFVLRPFVHYQITRYLKLKNSFRLLTAYGELVANWSWVDFAPTDWDLAADLWAERHRRGAPIQDADLLIAVTARRAGAVLVTNNTRHFEGMGLTLENWSS
jgi:tRNA(fMet)-specific endonuclease VapC